jgi:hypothetical protein
MSLAIRRSWAGILSRTPWRIRQTVANNGAWLCLHCGAFSHTAETFGSPTSTYCPLCRHTGPWRAFTPEIQTPKEFLAEI